MGARAVLVDFYGTMARASAWGPTYQDLLDRHGYVLPDEVRRRWTSDAFDGIDHQEHSTTRERYVAWERARLASMVRDCGVADDDIGALVDDLYEGSKAWTMVAYEEVPDVLATLRADGVAVVVCSNWDWDLERALDQAGLTPLVDAVVTSARAGARKPHARIFEVALAAAGVGPDDALFVGDTWGADVLGARAAGLRAVHVRRPDRTDQDPPELPPGVVRVPDLRPLPDLVA